MPATAAHIQQGILCRKGRTGMRTAVSPTWGSISIDDIYSGARKGQRFFTVSAIVGDVILDPAGCLCAGCVQGVRVRAMTAPEVRAGLEFRVAGRTLSGRVMTFGDISPEHRERFLPGAFGPAPSAPLNIQHDRSHGGAGCRPVCAQ